MNVSFTRAARVWDALSEQPLTEPWEYDSCVFSAQFSPDGKRIVTASEDQAARIWDVAPSGAGCPAWLLPLAEAVSGRVLNKQGVLEDTKIDRAEVLQQIRQKLNESAPDDWVVWGRWFLADSLTRTVSPYSRITVVEYLEHRLQENTPESLAEAERLALGDPKLLWRISEARRRPVK
jgi:hypothetical protein